MACYGDVPWHEKGKNAKGAMTWEEAEELGELGWSVDTERVFTASGIVVNNTRAVVRLDNKKVLGIVSDS